MRGRPIAVLPLLAATLLGPALAGAETIYGTTFAGMGLTTFDSATPGTTTGVGPFPPASQIHALDFRPATGELYGIIFRGQPADFNYRLVKIDKTNAAITWTGPPLPISGSSFALSFPFAGDVARIVTLFQHVLVDPDTGVATAVTDLPSGEQVAAIADAPSLTLYGIEVNLDELVRIGGFGGFPSPDAGAVTTVGPLNTPVGPPSSFDTASFDISASSGVAYAALTAMSNAPSQLFTVNLQTGAATLVGTIGNPAVNAIAVEPGPLAAPPIPTASEWMLFAFAALLAALALRRLAAP